MRNLKYAILGLLMRKPMTGYDIKLVFDHSLGNFWSAHHSQIYPELAKLAREALVTFDTVIQGEVMEKKFYTITDAGRADFLAWMARKDAPEPTQKEVFRLKSYFSENWADEEMKEHIRHQIAAKQAKLRQLEKTIKQDYGGCDVSALPKQQRGDYMLLRGGILREKAYIKWLKESLQFI